MNKAFIAVFLLLAVSAHAVLFDGVDDTIGFGTCGDTMFKEDAAISISAWINAVIDGEANTGVIIRRGGEQLRMNTTHQIEFRVAGTTSLSLRTVNNAIVVNTWTHVLATWDGSLAAANAHIYINGVEASYSVITDGVALTDTSPDTVIIGNNVGATVTFNGQITDVAVWSSVLNSTAIQLLFRGKVHNMPLMISPSTLQAFWPLDDFADGVTLSGTDTIKDRSPNGHHGSQTNSPVSKAASVLSYP